MSAPTTDLAAGRELDALVAEHVMSDVAWDVMIEGCSRGGRACRTRAEAATYRDALEKFYTVGDIVLHGDVPHYSTEIAAAWLVVENWRARGESFQLDSLGFSWPDEKEQGRVWRCMFAWGDKFNTAVDEAPTAPLAICRAALAAVEAL